MSKLAIAVDLGGTKTASAVVDADGQLVTDKAKVPTPAALGGEAMLDAMAQAIEIQYGQVDRKRLAAIGIGTAGAVDTQRGVIVSATDTVVGWKGTDIVGGLRARLPWARKLPIQVQNDVDAHAVGESWRGAGAGAASMLMVAVGTGIGAAFCIDGKVWRGGHHMAGEIGALQVDFGDGPASFEQQAAGPAIARVYRELSGRRMASEPQASLETMPIPQPARGQDVMLLASAGDPLAVEVLEVLGTRLGRVLGWLVLALDPAVVVLGGGVPDPKSVWWAAMERELRTGLPPILTEVPVRRAQQRNNAALLGAARDAFRLAGIKTH